MSVRMRRAAASEAKPLVGLYAQSGKGKTYSALALACGFAGGDMSRVVMIETEAGRGEALAAHPKLGGFNVIPLRESFAPKEYGDAIAEAERSGALVLIIDSASHEWEGVGGVLAMAAANQEAGKKGPLVWQRPKIEHAREFMLRITQSPIALVIVCMRAKFPMYEVKARDIERWEAAGAPGGEKARPRLGEWARSWELEPKQSEDILYEMFVHAWLDDEHRVHLTKTTIDEMAEIFRDGEPITIETGERLAVWAKVRAVEYVSAVQRATLETACKVRGIAPERLLAKARVATLSEMPAADYEPALAWVNKQSADPVRANAPRE